VASYAIRVGGATLLIDPLVDDEQDPILDELDAIADGPVRILISIPYHTRSAELLWCRYRTLDARILGHEFVRKRLHDSSGFHPLVGGEDLDGVARFHRIGRPARAEIPIEIPSQRALVFGDAVIETGGQLRVWDAPLTGERRQRWYAERLLPTLRALAESDPERILVTHGQAVLRDGRRELEGALARGPWQPGGTG
jgi:glyoxylase-like metal-dependent hydrolase (beta-lactamase superfamily II)